MSGLARISAERKRQRSRQRGGEAWSASHDDGHRFGEIALAAAVYAIPPEKRDRTLMASLWPRYWTFKPREDDRIRELEKAGALIAAEIDRLERADTSPAKRPT